MAIVLGSFGTGAFGTGNLTPGQPAGYSIGDIIFIAGGEYTGTDALPTAAGFTQKAPAINTNRQWLFTRTATTNGADTMPTINQAGGSHPQWCVAFTASGCTETVDVTGQDRVSTSPNNFLYPNSTYTPVTAGDLVLAISQRAITNTHAGVTIGNISNASFGAPVASNYPNSATGGFVINAWIQGAATAIAAMTQTTSFTDANSQVSGLVIAFRPTALANAALMAWPKQTFVREEIQQF